MVNIKRHGKGKKNSDPEDSLGSPLDFKDDGTSQGKKLEAKTSQSFAHMYEILRNVQAKHPEIRQELNGAIEICENFMEVKT